MNKRTLRSAAAILLGWVLLAGGSIVTMIMIALFNSESFRPGSQFSTGWLLVMLLVSFVWSAIGGFVTGVIARRSEIKHGIGLVLFAWVVSLFFYFSNRYKSDGTPVPSWYVIAGYISLVPSVLLGAWLRAKQRALIRRLPAGVTQTANNFWLSIMMSIDLFRYPIAVGVSGIIFFVGGYLGILLGGACLFGILKFLSQEYLFAEFFLIWVVVSFVLSFMLARRAFRRIMAVDTSLMKDAG